MSAHPIQPHIPSKYSFKQETDSNINSHQNQMDNSIGVNLPIPMDPMGMNPHHPYNSILNKANLRFEGNIEEMVLNWTDEERQARRRLIQFWRRHENNNIFCTFKPVNPSERPPNSIVVSCIYWQEKMDCFITSVDCIYLLESLISVRFTVEEKNRIRRNLEGFRPLTVSKCKPESAEFFKLIMSFPNPKPRNIEKDVKVFPWKVLPYALKKIVGKYTASYTSAIGMDPFQASMSPSANQFPLMASGLPSHYGHNGSSLNPAFAGRNAQRRFSQPATSLSMSMYNRDPKSGTNNYSMDLSHPLAGQLSSNNVNFEQSQSFNFNSNSGGDNQSDTNSNYSSQISNPFTAPTESNAMISQMDPISEVSGMEGMGMNGVFDQSQSHPMNLVNRRAAMFQRRHSLADPYSMHRYQHRRISSGGDTTGMDQMGGLMGQNNYPFGSMQQMPIGSLNQNTFENKDHYDGHDSGANSAGNGDGNPPFGHSKDMGYYTQNLMNSKGSGYGQSVEAPITEE